MSNLDRAFAALADPTCRRIVARLTCGELCVTDLAQPFAMSLNAVSEPVSLQAWLVATPRRVSRPGRRLLPLDRVQQ